MTSNKTLKHDWFPSALPHNVKIGSSSWLYSAYAFLHFRSEMPDAVLIGESCGIYNGSFFELGANGQVEIGDFTTLVGVIFCADSAIRIGNYCFLAHEVVIADTYAAEPSHIAGSVQSPLSQSLVSVTLANDVWVGAGAVLLKGAHIGEGSVIGAGSVVDFEVPAFSIVAGNPARCVGTVPQKPLHGDTYPERRNGH